MNVLYKAIGCQAVIFSIVLQALLAVLRSSPYNEWRLLAAKTTELLLERGYDLPALATSPSPV